MAKNNEHTPRLLGRKKKKNKQKEKQFKYRKNFSNARGFAPSNFPFQGEPYRGPSPFQPGFPGMSGPRFPIGGFHC